jgi:rhomboid protease GluP
VSDVTPLPSSEDRADITPFPSQPQPVRVPVRLPERMPIVVYSIMALTIFVYILQYLTQNGLLTFGLSCPYFNTADLPACFGLKVNELIIAGQWWRLITPIFLHASLLHIGFNMYALYVLGPELERHFDHLPFLALYVLTGFAGVVLSFILTAAPSLGASTAIFGLLAAQGMFVYRNQRLFGRRARAALTSIINIAVINLVIGLTPGIDDWGHVGGMIGGLIFTGIAGPKYDYQEQGFEIRLINRTPSGFTLLAILAVGIIFTALVIWRTA